MTGQNTFRISGKLLPIHRLCLPKGVRRRSGSSSSIPYRVLLTAGIRSRQVWTATVPKWTELYRAAARSRRLPHAGDTPRPWVPVEI